jgi:hypothetical protein
MSRLPKTCPTVSSQMLFKSIPLNPWIFALLFSIAHCIRKSRSSGRSNTQSYTHMHTYMHTYMCVSIHTHTHTHTHIHAYTRAKSFSNDHAMSLFSAFSPGGTFHTIATRQLAYPSIIFNPLQLSNLLVIWDDSRALWKTKQVFTCVSFSDSDSESESESDLAISDDSCFANTINFAVFKQACTVSCPSNLRLTLLSLKFRDQVSNSDSSRYCILPVNLEVHLVS